MGKLLPLLRAVGPAQCSTATGCQSTNTSGVGKSFSHYALSTTLLGGPLSVIASTFQRFRFTSFFCARQKGKKHKQHKIFSPFGVGNTMPFLCKNSGKSFTLLLPLLPFEPKKSTHTHGYNIYRFSSLFFPCLRATEQTNERTRAAQ